MLANFRKSDGIILGGIGAGLLFYIIGEQIFSSSTITGTFILYSCLFHWGLAILLFLYARIVEKNKLLMWQEKSYAFLYYLVTVIVLYLLCLACGIVSFIPRLFGWHENSAGRILVETTLSRNMPLLVFAAVTAGVTEELIFRAYLVPRFQLLFSNKFAAVTISALMFSAAHYRYHSLMQFIGAFGIGVVFAIHYQKYRNIKMLMIAHALVDLIAFLSFWLLHVKLHLPLKEARMLF